MNDRSWILDGIGVCRYEIFSVVDTKSYFERKIGVIRVET